MNAATRSELDAMPIPVEGGFPVAACVIEDADGWRTAWMYDGGLRKEPFGPTYASARDAAAAAQHLNGRAGV